MAPLRPCSRCDKPLGASPAESHVVCRPEDSSRNRSPGASGLWVSAGARSFVRAESFPTRLEGKTFRLEGGGARTPSAETCDVTGQ